MKIFNASPCTTDAGPSVAYFKWKNPLFFCKMIWFPIVLAATTTLDYGGFKLEFDCEQKSALRWEYQLDGPGGNAPRPRAYYYDPNLDKNCQQFSLGAYKTQGGYDRGHLVTSFHMNMSPEMRKKAHYMNNIVPQVSSFNQGIWGTTEKATECRRDVGVQVYGGVIYTDESNDYFVESHGIKTPEFFWKVLVADGEVLAWLFPNSDSLTSSAEDYRVTVSDIEKQLNDGLGPIPVQENMKSTKSFRTWSC